MKRTFPPIKQGDPLIISNGVLYDACCDCGLVHKRVFTIKNLKFKGDKKALPTVIMRTYRADTLTERQRKKRHLFILDNSITVGELRKL